MISPEIHLIGESSNDDPSHHYSGFNTASDHVSSSPADNTAPIDGMAPPNTGVVAPIGGTATAEGGLRSNSNVCENPGEDEVESPLPNPPPMQVIVPCPFIPPPPPPLRKPSKAKKVFPLVVLLGYTWVHREFEKANFEPQKAQSEHPKDEQDFVESQDEALKTKLAIAKDLAKALQDMIDRLNEKFSLFMVNAKKVEGNLKSDLSTRLKPVSSRPLAKPSNSSKKSMSSSSILIRT
ncbi:hypothetical protein JHK85_012920 [Glycine max]|nr:hypothetical protein JHK85_012920 [Glycine max]KAG5057584.1 hypothetical protein JHK86_012580 [Glycine max]